MRRKHNKNLVSHAKEFRRSMTPYERHLWFDFLRSHEPRFRRQKILGSYIVDFYCAQAKLVIEVDGESHDNEEAIVYDDARTTFLEDYGLTILRFTNDDIKNHFGEVCQCIDEYVKQPLSQLR